jgi:RNA polymerase sigma factor (sigma-70 family)
VTVSPPLEQRIERDSSFERLYRLHRRDVYGAVLRDVRDPAEAEDVTQIAFLNAYRAMRKGQEPEKPRAWLVTIARNVIRRRYREVMRRHQEVSLDPEIAVAHEDVDGPTAGEITAAIRRLPETQQRVILLREIQGHSYTEIAEEMDLSLAAVETLIFRARRSLSSALEVADRVPATQSRRRGLFFLPLPGFSKLSFGFSLSRAGAAAFVGSVAIVTVPLGSGAEPTRPAPDKREPLAARVAPSTLLSPTERIPVAKERTSKKKRPAEEHSSGQGGKGDTTSPSQGGSSPSLPPVVLPTVPDVVTIPQVELQLPVEPLPLPEPPALPEVPPPPDLG